MKKARQAALLKLIIDYDINTQDELIVRLRDAGFQVTQATISRDIRELKISKMSTGRGTYRYAPPKDNSALSDIKFSNAVAGSIMSVQCACNIVVVKTFSGLAQAVAVIIDEMNLDEILGCVAGDDTIMVVSRNEYAAQWVCEHILKSIVTQ